MAELLLEDDGAYVHRLLGVELLEECRASGDMRNCVVLADLARSLALLGNEALLDLLLADRTFLQFATVMEYDSSLPAGTCICVAVSGCLYLSLCLCLTHTYTH